MEFLERFCPLFLVLGMLLVSVSLHYKQPLKELRYGWTLGWAENLNTHGRVLFFFGLFISIFGAMGMSILQR